MEIVNKCDELIMEISYKARSKIIVKEGIPAKCIPRLNKGSGIIEFTTREGKLIIKRKTFKLFIKKN